MMKFFRKYNKQLLAVFMALLMIVFIGGTALEGMLMPNYNPLVGNSRFGEIYFQDQVAAQSTTSMLAAIGKDWRRPLGGGNDPLEEVDWVLLTREAERYGSPSNLAAAQAVLGDESALDAARRLRVKTSRLLEAVAEMRAVQQTALAVAGSTTPSEAAIQAATRDALETVKANFVVIPAKAFVDESQMFPEDELRAQFEKYRSTEAGEGLNFGYYRLPALKVQFIEISRDAVVSQMKVAGLERRAKQLYEERRTTDPAFRRPPELLPATKPTDGPPLDLHLSWAEAQPIAEEMVRKQQADQAVEDAAQRLLRFAADDWIESPRGEDGYRPTPDKVKSLDYYDQLIHKAPEQEAIKVWTSNFFTQKEAKEVAIIGATTYRSESGAPRRFGDLAFRTQSIVSQVPKEDPNSSDYIAPFQSSPFVLKNQATGNAYIFRVVESRPGRPAESLEEVRDLVLRDLRLKSAFEEAMGRAESVRACETWPTIRDSFDHDEELQVLRSQIGTDEMGFFEPAPFSRVSRFQAARGRSPLGVFVGAGVKTLPNDVVDQIFPLEDDVEKIAVFPLPDRAAALVVQWLETKRPTDEDFESARKQILAEMTQDRFATALKGWLDPERVRTRNGFVLAGGQ